MKGGWTKVALYGGAAAALVLCSSLVFAVVVNGRVVPGTTVAGIPLGLQSAEDAHGTVEEQLQSYETQPLALTLDGETLQGTLTDFGLSIDHARTLDNLDERIFSWGDDNPLVAGTQVFQPDNVRAVVTVDQAVAAEKIESLTSARTTPAVDAALSIEEGTVQVSAEQPGFGFDVSLVQAMLVYHVAELDGSALALTSQTIQPDVTAAMLESARQQAVAFVAEPITLSARGTDKTLHVKSKELGTWLSVDTAQALVPDEDGINATVDRFAEQVDSDTADKVVVAGTDYVVEKGSDGYGLDRAAAAASLRSIVVAATALTTPTSTPGQIVELATAIIQPEVREIGMTGAPSSGTGKEIVVVLGEQRLYAWDDGVLAKTFLISSGSTFPTHLGTFAVYNKILSHTMAGADYYLPGVPHSMYYDGPRAIHGAYWHNNFGTPMSHGCINEPLPEAEWLYNWTPMGTTVRVVE